MDSMVSDVAVYAYVTLVWKDMLCAWFGAAYHSNFPFKLYELSSQWCCWSILFGCCLRLRRLTNVKLYAPY